MASPEDGPGFPQTTFLTRAQPYHGLLQLLFQPDLLFYECLLRGGKVCLLFVLTCVLFQVLAIVFLLCSCAQQPRRRPERKRESREAAPRQPHAPSRHDCCRHCARAPGMREALFMLIPPNCPTVIPLIDRPFSPISAGLGDGRGLRPGEVPESEAEVKGEGNRLLRGGALSRKEPIEREHGGGRRKCGLKGRGDSRAQFPLRPPPSVRVPHVSGRFLLWEVARRQGFCPSLPHSPSSWDRASLWVLSVG